MNQQILDWAEIPDSDPETDYIDLDGYQEGCCFWRVSLDDLITNPLRVNELPPEEQRKLLLQLAAVQTVLAATVVTAPVETARPTQEPDELLTVEETARILNTTKRWIYANKTKFPFVDLSRRRLRFSKAGLEKWISSKANKMK